MSKTVAQIFASNPTTVVADTDLYYLVQSPYTPGADAAITGASLKAAFGAGGTINPGIANQIAYYASSGSTISGLTSVNNGVLITSGAGVPSISSTLPTAVQTNITSLGTITTGIWHGTVITGTFGGTGVNNGASTITIGGNVTYSGAFTFTGTLTGNTSVTFPTSGTLATTSQLPTPAALTKVDDTNVTLTLGGTPSTALLQATSLTLGWTGQLSLARGGTNANLTASNGGIFYSTSTAGAILAGTATANQVLLSGSSTTPAWSTATYPATTTINQILYSSAANTITGIASVNSAVLSTNGSGVPSFSTTLPSGIAATNMNLTTPALGTPSSGNLVNCTGYSDTNTIKAWGRVTQSGGTYTLQGKFNVTSITKNSTGNITVTFTNAFADTTYTALSDCTDAVNAITRVNTTNTGTMVIIIIKTDGTSGNVDAGFSFVCFGV